MKGRTARSLGILVAAATVITGALLTAGRSATADTYTDQISAAQQRLGADAAAAGQLNAEIAAAGNEASLITRAIADLDTQIAIVEGQVSQAQAQLDRIDAALSAEQDNLVSARAHLADDRNQLALEMVVMYKAQNTSSSFSNLLGSGDFNGYWQHVLDVGRLNASERTLIGTVALEATRIAADVARISAEKSDQGRLLRALRGMVGLLNTELASRQQREQLLQEVQAQDQRLLLVNEMARKQLDAQIAHFKAQEAAALAAGGGNGHFAWPERGPIAQGFGCTTFEFEPYDPACASKHFHSGVDIVAPCGASVAAADSGIAHVYYSAVGFGDHVIIVHGNGWVSVYGHVASFAVGDGQTVHRGQTIGYEGSTGNSTGCHLHFEVDLNGTPRSPLAYLS